MIELKQLSKTFYQGKHFFKALDDINLKIEQGDILGVIGFSGAGKSTLIRCINLLERPDKGEVLINGKDLLSLNAKQLARERKKIGMIFQHFNLLSSKTVFENVALPLELDGISRTIIADKVNKLLATVGLDGKADDYPKSLSGGQKQRVAIARALANDPHLLLCDEATSALDPFTTQSILQLLKDINREMKITILLITHEMEVVKAICNQVAVIERGKLLAKGTLKEVFIAGQHPVVSQLLTGSDMKVPLELRSTWSESPLEGLFPFIDVVPDDRHTIEQVLSFMHNSDIAYEIFNANRQQLQLHLTAAPKAQRVMLAYLKENQIQYIIKGYA